MKPVDLSKVYRLFYPAVPAIISCNEGSNVYSMPVVSIISVSNDPPLIGVASSPDHSTCRAIVKARRFSVCWVDASQARALEFLGTTPHTVDDKLASAGLLHKKGRKLDVPLVEGAVATLECSLDSRRRFGDHDLLVGRVHDARAIEDFKEYWVFERYEPVLYAGMRGGSFMTYQP
ncbi:MAG TPA: flavin reductase family protein [Nitrososphaerales archaeon]|nr:flavin reductase family protein [Nitrososphaerales archaeon]